MTEDIRTLTGRVADEPGSLAFLELGEALRARGQLDAALKIARGGVARHPGLASAHDLVARILCDRDDLAGAFEAWADALRADPLSAVALKGIAFLYYRAGDLAGARLHLERALEANPDDLSIPTAMARMGIRRTPVPAPSTPETAPAPLDVAIVLADRRGMRLRGELHDPSGRDMADAVAAELAGVAKAASRAARLLQLGDWETIAIESPDRNVVLLAPTPDSVLLASHEVALPMARLTLVAERAGRDAQAWLERER